MADKKQKDKDSRSFAAFIRMTIRQYKKRPLLYNIIFIALLVMHPKRLKQSMLDLIIKDPLGRIIAFASTTIILYFVLYLMWRYEKKWNR